MKKFVISFILSCCGLFAMGQAGTATTDYLSLEAEDVLMPGVSGDEGCVLVSVNLNGLESRKYTAYSFELVFPEGIDPYCEDGDYWVMLDEDSGMYPYTKKAGKKIYTHSVSYSYEAESKGPQTLVVTCYSSNNDLLTDVTGSLVQIYMVAKSWAKPGVQNIAVKNVILTTVDNDKAVEYDATDHIDTNVTVSNTAVLEINLTPENQWGTIVCPFDATIPTGIDLFTVSGKTNDNVTLKRESSIKAYTPYVIRTESGYVGTITGTVDATKYTDIVGTGLLLGAVEDQTVGVGYVLQKKSTESVAKFYVLGESLTIPAGKCWLNTTSSAKELNIVFDDVTEISENEYNNCKVKNVIYNIAGQKVGNDYKGIVIQEGKKTLNK